MFISKAMKSWTRFSRLSVAGAKTQLECVFMTLSTSYCFAFPTFLKGLWKQHTSDSEDFLLGGATELSTN